VNAAGVCKTGVAEFYQAKGLMPADEDGSRLLDKGTASAKAPSVAAGGIINVDAAGTLADPARRQRFGHGVQVQPDVQRRCLRRRTARRAR
jgi:hypothetical protein